MTRLEDLHCVLSKVQNELMKRLLIHVTNEMVEEEGEDVFIDTGDGDVDPYSPRVVFTPDNIKMRKVYRGA